MFSQQGSLQQRYAGRAMQPVYSRKTGGSESKRMETLNFNPITTTTIITIIIVPKWKFRFPGHQISWISEWLSDWVRDFSPWASSAMEAEIWHKGSLGAEDDARASNTLIAQRKRAIPHWTIKRIAVVTSVLVTALCNPAEAFASDLGDDQSRYWLLKLQHWRSIKDSLHKCENRLNKPVR